MEILKGNRLTIFENKVVVDKNLPKWRRAEAGLEKTSIGSNNSDSNNMNLTLSEYFITNAENDPDAMSKLLPNRKNRNK